MSSFKELEEFIIGGEQSPEGREESDGEIQDKEENQSQSKGPLGYVRVNTLSHRTWEV